MRLVSPGSSGLLVTRDQGKALLAQALETLKESSALVTDLAGAEAVSPSFVDEFFGGLLRSLGPEEFRKRVRIRGTTGEDQILIGRVLARSGRHS